MLNILPDIILVCLKHVGQPKNQQQFDTV